MEYRVYAALLLGVNVELEVLEQGCAPTGTV
jgi:hypothetical protein